MYEKSEAGEGDRAGAAWLVAAAYREREVGAQGSRPAYLALSGWSAPVSNPIGPVTEKSYWTGRICK